MYHLCCGSYSQKAELLEVGWMQIRGTFDTTALDKDTTWSILCLLKHNDSATCRHTSVEVSVSQKDGTTICSRMVHLNPDSTNQIQQEGKEWLALEVGRFQHASVSRKGVIDEKIVLVPNLFLVRAKTTRWRVGIRRTRGLSPGVGQVVTVVSEQFQHSDLGSHTRRRVCLKGGGL
ncbi:hypothetical protein EJ110_NYTH41019 [Nymphaea thermarum]|nr:hypothetical protein EJ110_NYTH41019 [Nymphaea thermarum]